MKNLWRENETKLKYQVIYYMPLISDAKVPVAKVEQEIDISTFNAEIPNETIGYKILYGSTNIQAIVESYNACTTYTGEVIAFLKERMVQSYYYYNVYKGKVYSFKEAKERFPADVLWYDKPKKKVEDEKTTEMLREQFSNKIDLQQTFEKFIQECNSIQLPTNSEEEFALAPPAVGVVVMEKTNTLRYLYDNDIVIQVEES